MLSYVKILHEIPEIHVAIQPDSQPNHNTTLTSRAIGTVTPLASSDIICKDRAFGYDKPSLPSVPIVIGHDGEAEVENIKRNRLQRLASKSACGA